MGSRRKRAARGPGPTRRIYERPSFVGTDSGSALFPKTRPSRQRAPRLTLELDQGRWRRAAVSYEVGERTKRHESCQTTKLPKLMNVVGAPRVSRMTIMRGKSLWPWRENASGALLNSPNDPAEKNASPNGHLDRAAAYCWTCSIVSVSLFFLSSFVMLRISAP